MDQIRIGVIGLGFGQHHVRTLANMAEAKLVAVADRSFDQPGGITAFAARYNANAYSDGLEMMQRERLDAVSLCIAPRGREPLLKYAAENGIPMFVEKPWAANLDRAQRLAALCREHSATVMPAFSFRFHPAIVKLRALMDGELGQGLLLNGEYLFRWEVPAESWLWDAENGGGFFNENSCHLFDVVCHLLGDPASIFAQTSNPLNAPGDNTAAVTLRFASGATAALTLGGIGTSAFQNFPRLDIVTRNGQARLAGQAHVWQSLDWAARSSEVTQQFVRPPEGLGRTRYTDAFEHFFECIRTGQPPSATIEDGIRSVAIAQALYESTRTGSKVKL